MRITKSFRDAFRGIFFVWKEEANFRIECVVGVIVIVLMFVIPFSLMERALLVAAVFGVLLAEIINTALEDLCNKIEPNQDPVIGKIKDVSAGFVLMMHFGAFSFLALTLVSFFS